MARRTPCIDLRLAAFAIMIAMLLVLVSLFIDASTWTKLVIVPLLFCSLTLLVAYSLPRWQGTARDLRKAFCVMLVETVLIFGIGCVAFVALH